MVASKDNLCVCGCEQILTGRQKKYATTACAKLESRRKWVLNVYGLTLDEYDTILDFQDGVCALCGKEPKHGAYLHIDHSHDTHQSGEVLGLLDYYCNKFVKGKLSKEKIIALYNYVMNPPAQEALRKKVIAPGRPKKAKMPRKRRRNGR